MNNYNDKRNPHFHMLLDEIRILHDKKSHDYATDSNVFSNFEESAQVAGVTVEQAFLVLIGTKLSRLKQLLTSGKAPNNESVVDSYKDLTNYCAILTSYSMKKSEQGKLEKLNDKCTFCGPVANIDEHRCTE